jgi:uncharacterized transporter YbjL
MAHDIKALEHRIRSLGETVSKLSQKNYDALLIANIHRPGWTTVRENELVLAQLDMLQTHANALSHGLETLAGIADKIGRSELNPQPLPP